jgi:hypothetical protein
MKQIMLCLGFIGWVNVASAEAVAGSVELRFHEVTTLKKRRVVVPSWSKLERPIVCKLDFEVDGAGQPTTVVPAECPEALHRNAVKSAMRWEFEPHRVEGQPVSMRFRVVLKINH